MVADSNDEFLDGLASALAPPAAVPSAAEITLLRQLVADRGAGWTTAMPAPRLPRAGRGRLLLAAAAAIAILAGATVSVWHGLPRTVRVVASASGLPVESPALGDARHSLRQLNQALAQRDMADVATVSADLRRRIAALDLDDQRQLASQAAGSLAAADTLLKSPGMTPATATIPVTNPPTAPRAADRGPPDSSGSNAVATGHPTASTVPVAPASPSTTTRDGGGHDGGSDGGSSPGGPPPTNASSDGGGGGS